MGERNFRLRLADGQNSVEFEASPHTLKQELIGSFTRMRAKGCRSARLEVHDHRHGWCIACIDHQYQIISSPLVLDYSRVIFSIYETIQQCRQWPTSEDLKEKKARARRSSFFIVNKPQQA